MKKLLIFLPLLLFAKFYSIQLFTADKKAIKQTLRYYNNLPTKIKNLSVIYKTDSGYLTIRYLVAKKIKYLRKHTKHLKHYSFVTDDAKKIKKLFLQKYQQNKNPQLKQLLLKFKWLKVEKKVKTITFKPKKASIKHKKQ